MAGVIINFLLYLMNEIEKNDFNCNMKNSYSQWVVRYNSGNWKLSENKNHLTGEALKEERNLVPLQTCFSNGNRNYRFDFLYCIIFLKSVKSELFYIVSVHSPCIFTELINSH